MQARQPRQEVIQVDAVVINVPVVMKLTLLKFRISVLDSIHAQLELISSAEAKKFWKCVVAGCKDHAAKCASFSVENAKLFTQVKSLLKSAQGIRSELEKAKIAHVEVQQALGKLDVWLQDFKTVMLVANELEASLLDLAADHKYVRCSLTKCLDAYVDLHIKTAKLEKKAIKQFSNSTR